MIIIITQYCGNLSYWKDTVIQVFRLRIRWFKGVGSFYLVLNLRFTGKARLAFPITCTDFALLFFALSRLTAHAAPKPFDWNSSMVKDPLKSVQLNLKLTWKVLLQKVCQTAGFNFLSLTSQGYEFSRLNAIYFKKSSKFG